MKDFKFIANRVWISLFGIPPASEPAVSNLVKNIGGGCFIDVGANAGMYAIRYRKNFREVYAIEPHPKMAKALRRKLLIRLSNNVTILRFAASDRLGETTLFVEGKIGMSAGSADTIEPDFVYRPASHPEIQMEFSSANRGKKKINVQTMPLDSYSFPEEIELVKIDVEGAEFKVLAGATETLARTQRVIVEVHDRERKSEMQNYLHDKWAFKTRWLDPDHILGARVA